MKKHRHITNKDLYKDIEKIKAALFEASDNVKAKADELIADSLDTMKSKSNELQDDVAQYAAEQPFKALGVALLIGIVIGYSMHK